MHLNKRINEREFNIHIEGTGEPLLFVHGFPLDHTMWDAQLAEFSKTHQVIAPDLRGFGGSSSDDETVTMLDFANDLADILKELSIDGPVHFCGLSMGGYIAWQFFEQHVDKVKSLILCDTKAAADSKEAKQLRLQTAAKVLDEGPSFLAQAMVKKLFSPTTTSKNSEIVDQTGSVIRNTQPKSISAALQGMAARPEMTAILSSINIPCLIIVGEHDSITTSTEMQTIADAIPEAEFVEIDSAGHMSPLEQPQQVNKSIAEFLKRIG